MVSIKNFDYSLPKSLIAQEPAMERHGSRLLVYNLKNRDIKHKKFADIIDFLRKGDIVVINDTKVIKTRLHGKKKTGGNAAITIISHKQGRVYEAFVKCKNPIIGTKLLFDEGLAGTIAGKIEDRFLVRFNRSAETVENILEKKGDYTLPGYIKNTEYDRQRYQTVFAEQEGSIAAPTAGLHFSEKLMRALEKKGVRFARVRLHVGIGTFQEIKEDDYTKHEMHEEWVEVPEETAQMINERKGRLGKEGKLFIVGTTALRALETATDTRGKVHPYNGRTKLFVYPGYKFKLKFDGMITNFHLPRSTLLLLIATIIGNGDDWKRIYEEAKKKKYRFYSFGDAMMILL